ncbi:MULTISPECIES: CopD family protein [unclassified Chelatococcus]|uniref:CopD family protein n=1 Tax=unclassified Chelatococcus TaxID=2638111 RepID=UPI0020BEB885|nr:MULTISPECIES: CopD family protein [unclassified Chelatococcus]
MIWLKSVHIAAIAIWSAVMICLPSLYMQRARVPNKASLHGLQAMVRFLYVTIASPGAFIAIATGTVLIFLRRSFEPWFSLKLAFVGALVVLHILNGLVILRLFDAGNSYPVWRFLAVTGLTLLVVAVILAIVLAKPAIPDFFPHALAEAGALRRMVEVLNPFRK